MIVPVNLFIDANKGMESIMQIIKVIKSIVDLEDTYINFKQTVALEEFRKSIVPLHVEIIYKNNDVALVREAVCAVVFEYYHDACKKIHSYHKPTILVALVTALSKHV